MDRTFSLALSARIMRFGRHRIDPEVAMDMIHNALEEIFFPNTVKYRNDITQNKARLIHYTSAGNALNILNKECFWMRNARGMNDYREISHGINLIRSVFVSGYPQSNNTLVDRTRSILHGIFPSEINVLDMALALHREQIVALRDNTYISCLSLHEKAEFEHGRLSMWRTYTSGEVGVGLVLDLSKIIGRSSQLGAFSSPVYYYDEKLFLEHLDIISANIEVHKDFLQRAGFSTVKNYLLRLLRSIALCCKHPGFHEEKEWRVMHTPNIDDPGQLHSSIETIRGVPQQIYKIPLNGEVIVDGTPLNIVNLVEQIIIGPTQYPDLIGDAFVSILDKKGVVNACNRIKLSMIPLRT